MPPFALMRSARHLQADHRGLAAGRAGAGERLLGADLVRLGRAEGRAPRRRHQHHRADRAAAPADDGAARDLAAVPNVFRPVFVFPFFRHRKSSLWISGSISRRQTKRNARANVRGRRSNQRRAKAGAPAHARSWPACPIVTARGGIPHILPERPVCRALYGRLCPASKRDLERVFSTAIFHIAAASLTSSHAIVADGARASMRRAMVGLPQAATLMYEDSRSCLPAPAAPRRRRLKMPAMPRGLPCAAASIADRPRASRPATCRATSPFCRKLWPTISACSASATPSPAR